MKQSELKQKVYRIFNNEIEELTYAELLRDNADETTTPNGVAPRYHIRETNKVFADGTIDNTVTEPYQLWSWGTGGNSPYFTGQSFETEEEAELALYDTFVFDLEKSDANWSFNRNELEEQTNNEL